MTLFEKFKYKLSTSLKFVALLSFIFQVVLISLFICRIFSEGFILFGYIFYLYIIVIGFSRYVETKSKNIKEGLLNFFFLLNCFPIIFTLPFLIMLIKPVNYPTTEIPPEDVKFHIIDENGDTVTKRSDEIRLDVNSIKDNDSVVKFIIDK